MLIFCLYGVYIFKGTVDWIKMANIDLKCEYCFWIFNSWSDFSTLLLIISFLDTFREEY